MNIIGSEAISMSVDAEGDGGAKIISFPSPITDLDMQNIEASMETARDVKRTHVADATEFLMEQIEVIFGNYGIDITSTRLDIRDTVMLSQVIEGIGCRFYGIEHPIHRLIEDGISLHNEDGDEVDPDGNPVAEEEQQDAQ